MKLRGFLGIDAGTSGLKAVLVGEDERRLASAEEGYPISSPAPGHVEADPATWFAATASAARQMSSALAATEVLGIGVTGQMHGVVLCDESGGPLGPAILWPDRRAEPQLDRWRRLPDRQRAVLANPIVAGMTGPMLAWLAEHRPDAVSRAAVALLPKDVVRTALLDDAVGPPGTDRSDASATLLWNVPGDRWAGEVAAATGVPDWLLPPVTPSYRPIGTTGWLSRLIPGATAEVVVAAGAGDTPAALLAASPASIHINLGTGAQVLASLPGPSNPGAHPSTHVYADAADGWYAMAALQNGGLALERAAGLLGLDWAAFVAAAERGRAGAAVFLPFLSGERGGVATPSSQGGWLGVGIETTRDDLARAAVEGVLFAIRRSAELLGPQAAGTEQITLSGGGWRSRLLVQLMADITGRPVVRIGQRSASALGAARLAARCVGVELSAKRSADQPVGPARSPELHDFYQRWLDRCEAVDPSARGG